MTGPRSNKDSSNKESSSSANCSSEFAAYLFDLDGTLVDTAPDIAAALNRQLAPYGLAQIPVALVTNWVGTGSAQLIRTEFAHHGMPAAEDTVARVLAAYAADYARRPVEQSTPYPDAFAAVRELANRGARLAIVTNKLSAIARNVLRHFGIDDLFAVVIGGDDVARGKPDPMALHAACRQLAVEVSASVMVGDSRNDIRAARAAGMTVIAVSYGYNHGEPIGSANPDRIVASLAELL